MNNFFILMTAFASLLPTGSANVNLTQTFVEREVTEAIEIKLDVRVQKIDAYFAKRNMPLQGYGKDFVEVADRYGLDWRLLPAISVRESSGGKRLLNNNPFGWGSAKIPFENFGDAIEVVGWNLSGNNPNTSGYYGTDDNRKKLYWYNGTVLPSYPSEVLGIMDLFESTEI